jgi:hypothetical protein
VRPKNGSGGWTEGEGSEDQAFKKETRWVVFVQLHVMFSEGPKMVTIDIVRICGQVAAAHWDTAAISFFIV